MSIKLKIGLFFISNLLIFGFYLYFSQKFNRDLLELFQKTEASIKIVHFQSTRNLDLEKKIFKYMADLAKTPHPKSFKNPEAFKKAFLEYQNRIALSPQGVGMEKEIQELSKTLHQLREEGLKEMLSLSGNSRHFISLQKEKDILIGQMIDTLIKEMEIISSEPLGRLQFLRDDVLQSFKEQKKWLSRLKNSGSLVIFLILFIAVFFFLSFNKIISIFESAINKIQRGDYQSKIDYPNSKDEFGKLAETFNKMTKKIQIQINGLETSLKKFAEISRGEIKPLEESEKDTINLEYRESLNKLLDDMRYFQESQRKFDQTKAMNDLAHQVAHDIRSPLTALEMGIKGLKTIPGTEKIIIQNSLLGIKRISNNLLNFGKETVEEEDSPQGPVMIFQLLEEIILEKKLQFKEIKDLKIKTKYEIGSYDIFCLINSTTFKRIISNLINNALEAISAPPKLINVYLDIDKELAKVTIEDNGGGIPEEILPKILEKGFTKGKENGQGLGLFHASEKIKSWGGELSINSKIGEGTKISLTIPTTQAPSHFVPHLVLNSSTQLIILDDDKIIHEIWKEKLKKLPFIKYQDQVNHFYTLNSFEEFIKGYKIGKEDIFLIDHDLDSDEKTGTDLISEFQLQKNALLVSGHIDVESILQKCEELNIGFIPKLILEDFKIIGESPYSPEKVESGQFVFIDDDRYLRLAWKNSAKDHEIELHTFSHPQDFLDQYEKLHITKEYRIYIDRELGDDIPKGEEWAQKFYNLGFLNIYLSTGHNPEKFKHLSFLKEVVPKSPPWDDSSEF